jgi:hypothetical protein
LPKLTNQFSIFHIVKYYFQLKNPFRPIAGDCMTMLSTASSPTVKGAQGRDVGCVVPAVPGIQRYGLPHCKFPTQAGVEIGALPLRCIKFLQ